MNENMSIENERRRMGKHGEAGLRAEQAEFETQQAEPEDTVAKPKEGRIKKMVGKAVDVIKTTGADLIVKENVYTDDEVLKPVGEDEGLSVWDADFHQNIEPNPNICSDILPKMSTELQNISIAKQQVKKIVDINAADAVEKKLLETRIHNLTLDVNIKTRELAPDEDIAKLRERILTEKKKLADLNEKINTLTVPSLEEERGRDLELAHSQASRIYDREIIPLFEEEISQIVSDLNDIGRRCIAWEMGNDDFTREHNLKQSKYSVLKAQEYINKLIPQKVRTALQVLMEQASY